MWHTFLYTRKSSEEEDRQTLSLDAQEREGREYAEKRSWVVSEVIRESKSARKPGRKLFSGMIAKARALRHKGHPVRVLTHKPDRLLRNIQDWARINDLIDAGVEFAFITGSFPDNAQGRMAFGINVLFAKYYVDNLSEEVKKGLRQKIVRGEWPGWAPLGYLNVREKTAPQRIIQDPLVGPLVRRAFEYYATGEFSLSGLALRLESEGLIGKLAGRRLSKSYIHSRILTNPFYCGLIRYKGELHPGSHAPLISLELFDSVQKMLGVASRPRPKRHEFRFKGILTCGTCGCAVIGDRKKEKYVYYRCTRRRGNCLEGYIREEELTFRIKETLRRRLRLEPTVRDRLRNKAKLMRTSTQGETEIQKALKHQLGDVERRSERLLDLHIGGHLSDDEYVTKKSDLTLQAARVREKLAALELPRHDPYLSIDRFIRICRDVTDILDRSNDQQFRKILRIMGSNYTLQCGRVNFEPERTFRRQARPDVRSQWCGAEDLVHKIVAFMERYDKEMAEVSNTPSDQRPD